ncbi:MAG: hypothetical protein R2804_12260 [Cyclobacteriaceae bacterium]
MTKREHIAHRLREVLLSGHWIANTNLKEQIESVTWKEATQKIDSLNTIAALTYHVNYYLGGILNVFNGGQLEIRDKYSFDLPPIHTEEDWTALVNQYLSNAKQFITHVETMDDTKLDAVFVDEKYGTYQQNIEGVIEHCYYHLGQISLLKKLISNT